MLRNILFSGATEKTSENAAVSAERMERIKKTVRDNSLLGAELIKRAEECGCAFVFVPGMKAAGSYLAQKNCIALNPSLSDERLASTVVHESRHCEQMQNAPEFAGYCSYRSADLIKVCRTREADAQAFQCASAYEMRREAPAVWSAYAAASPKVAAAYEQSRKEGKDLESSLPEAFKAWFDNGNYVDYYDRKVLSSLERAVDSGAAGVMSEKAPSDRLLTSLCQSGGKSYMRGEDLKFLETPRGSTVTEDIFFRCDSVTEKAFDKGLCEKEDLSFVGLYVKDGNRVVKASQKTPKRPEPEISPATLAMLSKGRGR